MKFRLKTNPFLLFRNVLRLFRVEFAVGLLNRARKTAVYYYRGITGRFEENHVFLFGAGLAFTLFTCIIPFLLILFWALSNILDTYSVEVQLDTLIDTMIPYTDYAAFVKEIVFERITEAVKYKNTVGLLGLGGLLITASGLSSSIRAILNVIFGVKDNINLLLAKIRDFTLIFFSVVVFLTIALLMPSLDMLRGASNIFFELRFLQYGIFQKLFTTIFSFVLLSVSFAFLYHFVPVKRIPFKSAFAGALWAAVLWEGMKLVFGLYLYKFSSYGKIYGTYALVVVVAFWVYYSATVFILGAVIGKLHHDNPLAKRRKTAPPAEIPIIRF